MLISALRQNQLENLGVRRRRIFNDQVTNKVILSSTSALPAGAKFLPTPPGQKPRALPDVIPAKTNSSGDVPTAIVASERYSDTHAFRTQQKCKTCKN